MTPERAGQLCDELDSGLRGSEHNLTTVANTIVVVLRDEAWRERRIRTGEIVRCESFLELLTAPPLHGFGEDPQKVEALLKDDAEALRLFRTAVTAARGQPSKERKHSNRIIKPRQGTTRAYTLTRLQKQAPAFYQRVIAGELSANAAAIAAGLRRPKTTLEQLHHWWKKATPDERASFLQAVTS